MINPEDSDVSISPLDKNEENEYSQYMNGAADNMITPAYDPSQNVPLGAPQFWDKHAVPFAKNRYEHLNEDIVLSFIPDREIHNLEISSETTGNVDILMDPHDLYFRTEEERQAYFDEIKKIRDVFEVGMFSKIELYRGVNGFTAKLIGSSTQNIALGKIGTKSNPSFVNWIKSLFGMR